MRSGFAVAAALRHLHPNCSHHMYGITPAVARLPFKFDFGCGLVQGCLDEQMSIIRGWGRVGGEGEVHVLLDGTYNAIHRCGVQVEYLIVLPQESYQSQQRYVNSHKKKIYITVVVLQGERGVTLSVS